MKDKIRKHTISLLETEDDFEKAIGAIDFFLDLFQRETKIEAGDLTDSHFTDALNGQVVAPVMAAHCLRDMSRTMQFLKGIHTAIKDLIHEKSHVRLLYAGCGPYATLLTPLLPLFTPDELQVTLVDINEQSLTAVEKMYARLELTSYLEETILTDCTSTEVSFQGLFDVIVSETMQAGLRTECQVPLTRNLVSFLSDQGTFIPQDIKLDAYWVGNLDMVNPANTEKERLGEVYSLDYQKVPKPGQCVTLPIEPVEGMKYLNLYTTIKLYKEIELKPFQSGLTMPITLDHFSGEIPEKIDFTYLENDKMGLELKCYFKESQEVS